MNKISGWISGDTCDVQFNIKRNYDFDQIGNADKIPFFLICFDGRI